MPVRILHVATRHRVGGAERNLRHTVAVEVSRGFCVHVAVGVEDLVRDFAPEAQVHEITDLARELSPRRDAGALLALRRVIREHDFDVVHTHQSKAGVIGRTAALGGRGRVIAHTVHMASFGPGYGQLEDHVFRRLERVLARQTDFSVFVGGDLMRRYAAAGAADLDRSWVIPSPIFNLEALVGARRGNGLDYADLRYAIGVPMDRPVVLAVGALDRRKRHDLVIRSLAPLLAAGECTLVIAGSGPEQAALRRLGSRLGVRDALSLRGFVRNVVPLYAAADVFVQASMAEGVPQAVVQAVAAGVPVVATEVDGVREAAPGEPHVTVLPFDGTGLTAAVRATLSAARPVPVPVGRLDEWRPSRVDERLGSFHESLEAHVWGRRRT